MSRQEGGIEVPELLFQEIPDDATPAEKLYMRAQLVLQSAYYTFGDRGVAPDAAALDRRDLVNVLAVAISMMVAADPTLKTNRDVRLSAEDVSKFIRDNALAMRESGDDIAERLLSAMGIWSAPIN